MTPVRGEVRLYGRVVGHGSFAQVTAGFAQVLGGAGRLAGLVPLDQDQLDDAGPVSGPTAAHALTVGPPGMAGIMTRATVHQTRAVMLAPNSNALPRAVMRMLGDVCTEILTPSAWGAKVIRKYTTLPVRVVPHGVFPAFVVHPVQRAQTAAAYAAGMFIVGHFATGERERKGTRSLVEAWLQLIGAGKIPDRSRLILVMDIEGAGKLLAWLGDTVATDRGIESVVVRTRLDAAPAAMAAALSHLHLVCQPSRGEGYGMVPGEALACGVPIVATRCTGHTEWFTERMPGTVEVQHGPDQPIDDAADALAPSVEPEAIAAALFSAYQQWSALNAEAARFAPLRQVQWAWEKQLADWLGSLP